MIEITKFEVGHYKPPYEDKWLPGPISNKMYSIRLSFINHFDKGIKYITFYVVPLDRVAEPIRCTLHYGGNQTAKLKVTGPIWPSEAAEDITFQSVFQTYAFGNVLLRKYDVEFMDGTTESNYVSKLMYGGDD